MEGNCTQIPGGSTALAFSALKWFEKVRGSSLQFNRPEVVYRYPTHIDPLVEWRCGLKGSRKFAVVEPPRTSNYTHLDPLVKMWFEKVRYSQTTLNYIVFYALKWLEMVRGSSLRMNHPEHSPSLLESNGGGWLGLLRPELTTLLLTHTHHQRFIKSPVGHWSAWTVQTDVSCY